MIDFKYPEDREYFQGLICSEDESIEDFEYLFDFRPPLEKRVEFNSLRPHLTAELIKLHGEGCMIDREGICDESTGFVIDHLVPLSSNVLNKSLRNMIAPAGKKVFAESYGSNNIENLVIACNACNNNKKHRFLDSVKMMEILVKKKLHLKVLKQKD